MAHLKGLEFQCTVRSRGRNERTRSAGPRRDEDGRGEKEE